MREYQENICNAVVKKQDWIGNNTSVTTINGVTKVIYYRTEIARVNHAAKSATFDNGGYTNASTTARINAVKDACKELGYNY